MPELPEVETIRRDLARTLPGRRITAIEIREGRLRHPVPVRPLRRTVGLRLGEPGRRGKVLLLHLETKRTILIHFGMSGSLALVDPGSERIPHDHIIFSLSGGAELRYNDPRRFGLVDVAPTDALPRHPSLCGLGPEPLDPSLDGAVLEAALGGSRRPVKLALLDGRAVAGVGNIYASEALYRARIHPSTPCARLSARRWASLAEAVRVTLVRAIQARGTTLRDYARPGGEPGGFRVRLLVYGHEGLPCPRCAARIRAINQAGRRTFFCGRCQR